MVKPRMASGTRPRNKIAKSTLYRRHFVAYLHYCSLRYPRAMLPGVPQFQLRCAWRSGKGRLLLQPESGHRQDGPGPTIVRVKRHATRGMGELALEVQDVAHLRAAERVARSGQAAEATHLVYFAPSTTTATSTGQERVPFNRFNTTSDIRGPILELCGYSLQNCIAIMSLSD